MSILVEEKITAHIAPGLMDKGRKRSSAYSFKIATAQKSDIYIEDILRPLAYMEMLEDPLPKKVTQALQVWMDAPQNVFEICSKVVQLLQNGRDMMTDLRKQYPIRNGEKAAYRAFGGAITINSIDYGAFLCLQQIVGLKQRDITVSFQEWDLNCSHGEGLNLYWNTHKVIPSVAQYKTMVILKNSSTFRMPYEILKHCSGFNKHNEIKQFLGQLTLFKRVSVDFKNILMKKTTVELSYPLILAIQMATKPDSDILKRQYKNENDTNEETLRIMRESGAIKKTEEDLKALKSSLMAMLESFGENKFMYDIINSS